MSDIINHINKNYLDITEVRGKESDPIIEGWINNFFDGERDDSTIAWCSIFMWNMLNELCIPSNKSAAARSWLKHGKELTEPEYGCIAVLWRGSKDGWKGHVGIYIRETDTHVLLLGGNQSNKVTYSWYTKNRVLGYRTIK